MEDQFLEQLGALTALPITDFVVRMHNRGPRKDTLKDTSAGKTLEISKEIAEVIGAERVRLNRYTGLLPTQEEKLGNLG